MLTILRRKALGAGSARGVVGYIEGTTPESVSAITHCGENAAVIRNDRLQTAMGEHIIKNTDWLVRWGCITEAGVPAAKTINTSEAIKQVSNKMEFRKTVEEEGSGLSPKTIFKLCDADSLTFPVILRPRTHAQGKNLWLVSNIEELQELVAQEQVLYNGWYASEYIKKVAEYRVYVVSGRVTTVANKIPDDAGDVAWNVHQGGKFEVVKWSEWDLNAVSVAVKAFNLSKLDFGGVDVMVDEDGRAYLIEINSSPSLPVMVKGEISYRQQCMAKAFQYIVEKGKDRMDTNIGSWKTYIHPAISDKAQFMNYVSD